MQHANGFECCIDRAVALACGAFFFAVDFHFQRRFCRAGAAGHVQVHELQGVVFFRRGTDQRKDVIVKNLFLAVCQILEPYEDVFELIVAHIHAKVFQLGAQSGAARMLAQRQGGACNTHIFGAHDFERFCVLEHSVLMNTAFMRKGIFADNGFVELHRKARHRADPPRDVHDLFGVDTRVIRHDVIAHLEGHNDLFQCRIASPFAQSVDGALDLPRAAFDGRERVGRRHAQVVVAMGGKDHVVRAGHRFDQAADQVGGFNGGGVADRVGNVDRCCARFDRNFNNTAEVIPFSARGVHRRPLDVVAEVAGVGDGLFDPVGHFILRQVRDRAVQRGCANKGVNAWLLGVLDRLPAAVDVRQLRASQSADHSFF